MNHIIYSYMISFNRIVFVLLSVVAVTFSITNAHGQTGPSLIATPDPNCSNTITYTIDDPNSDVKSPRWEIVTGSGTLSAELGTTVTIEWESSGTVGVDFFVGQMEDARLEKQFYYTEPTSGGGTISQPVAENSCGSASGTLTVAGASANAIWQSCTSGCSSTTDEGWTTISSGDYTNLTTTTSFRVKGEANCGLPYSNTITVTVQPVALPIITSSSTAFIALTEEYTFTTQAGMSNYEWTLTGGTVRSGQGTNSIKVQWTEGGTQSLRVSFTNGSGCSSTSEDFLATVVANPYNWIKETVVLVEGQSEATLNALTISDAQKNIKWTYFDGLGRPMQSISVQGSPAKKDFVQPIAYDEIGRESIKYLPYTDHDATNGHYKPNALRVPLSTQSEEVQYLSSKQHGFYQEGTTIAFDTQPYAKVNFEANPLNRVLEQGGPGTVWQPNETDTYAAPTDKTIKNAYEVHIREDEVLLWNYSYAGANELFGAIDAISASSPNALNYYATDAVIVTKTKDENGHEVIEYVDKLGRTILKRVQAGAGTSAVDDTHYASTYYIYDDRGSLVSVIPPEATRRLASEYFHKNAEGKEQFLKQWAFRYSYDERKRMITKQVPGAEPVHMVYDNYDRLALTQDGNQRMNNQWTFTKYDQLNRPVITGLYTHNASASPDIMKGNVSTINFFETYNGDELQHGYSNNVFPQNNTTILTVTYYDRYNFRDNLIEGSDYNYKPNDIVCNPNDDNDVCQESSAFPKVLGQVTGAKTNVLNTTDYLWSIVYYDDRYRAIQTISNNTFGGIDQTTLVFDFAGKVLKTKTTTRKPSDPEIAVRRRFNYDHIGRLEQTYHRIDKGTTQGKEVLLSEQGYNELGQLITKKLHRSALPVTADPSVGQPGVMYATDLVLEEYDSEITTYVASNSITIKPGFVVPSGGSFTARLGYSAEDAETINNAQTYAQEINYRYNIRGWLDNINEVEESGSGDLFSMDLNYHDPTPNGGLASI